MRRGSSGIAGVAMLVALVATACQPAPVPTAPGTARVVLLGDSIPSWLVRDGGGAVDAARFTFIDGTLPACEGAAGNPKVRSRTGATVPTPASCAPGWPSLYPPHLQVRADVAIVMSGTHPMLDVQLDGTWRHPCHTPARTWYRDDLTDRLRLLQSKADRVVLVLPAWPGANSGWIMPVDHEKRANCVRASAREAARAAGVATVDLGAHLCPGGATACEPWRTDDGIHLDAAHADDVLRWVLDQASPAPAPAGPAS